MPVPKLLYKTFLTGDAPLHIARPMVGGVQSGQQSEPVGSRGERPRFAAGGDTGGADWIDLWPTQRVAELEESNMAKTQITKSCQVSQCTGFMVNTLYCCTDICFLGEHSILLYIYLFSW